MEKIKEVFTEKVILAIMTVAIAICSSSFAAQYGANFDWRYSLLFFVALAALTFHYAKMLPSPVLAVMRGITVVGLVVFTIFVSCAAWLDRGTSQSDPQIVAINQQIDTLKEQITDRNLEIAALFASGNPVNARRVSQDKRDIEARLDKAQQRLAKLQSNYGTYESGSMAIFGHIAKITGQDQELVNLVVMGSLLLVMVCMEITMGAALTSDYTVVAKVKQTVPSTQNSLETVPNSQNSTKNSPESTVLPQKSKGKHVKNRTRTRTFIHEYHSKHGKYPTYETVQTQCKVGKSLVSEIMKEIKGSRAA